MKGQLRMGEGRYEQMRGMVPPWARSQRACEFPDAQVISDDGTVSYGVAILDESLEKIALAGCRWQRPEHVLYVRSADTWRTGGRGSAHSVSRGTPSSKRFRRTG